MSTHSFQLGGHAAEIYEAQKVPAIFKPLAEETVARVRIRDSDRVLDVACGTGIVSRLIAVKVPGVARMAGVDLNPGMLQVARKLSDEAGLGLEWYQHDVSALPFQAREFTVCFCQQGLQYFPDKPAALGEIHRVLAPEGRLILSVWSEISPLFEAMSEALAIHVGDAAAHRAVAPFAFRDRRVIEQLLKNAGFALDPVQTITVERKIGPAEESLPREMAGSPVAEDLEGLEPERLDRIVSDMSASLAAYRLDEGFSVPQVSYLFSGMKYS